MKTLLNVKIDTVVKRKAHKVAEEFGLTLSALVNIQLKQLIRDQEILLSVTPKMSAGLEKILDDVEEDIKHNKNLSPAISNRQELDRYLDSI